MAQNISQYFAMLANGKRRFRTGESRQERSDSMHLYREAARCTTDLQTQLPVARKSPRICIKTDGPHRSHLPRHENKRCAKPSAHKICHYRDISRRFLRFLYLESKFHSYFQSRFSHVCNSKRKDFRIN